MYKKTSSLKHFETLCNGDTAYITQLKQQNQNRHDVNVLLRRTLCCWRRL